MPHPSTNFDANQFSNFLRNPANKLIDKERNTGENVTIIMISSDVLIKMKRKTNAKYLELNNILNGGSY